MAPARNGDTGFHPLEDNTSLEAERESWAIGGLMAEFLCEAICRHLLEAHRTPNAGVAPPSPLELVSDEELLVRFAEIADSMWIYDPELRICPFLVPDLPVWKAGVACASEVTRRGMATGLVFGQMDLSLGMDRREMKSKMGSRRLPITNTDVPVKFMRKEFLRPFVERGEVRLSPASLFVDTSLTWAQRDNELTFTSLTHPSETKIRHKNPSTGEYETVEPIGNISFITTAPTDFYIFCATFGANARHFADFGSDACIFINDAQEFAKRVNTALAKAIPEFHVCGGGFQGVFYLDRYNMPVPPVLFMTKDVKYWYQFEKRLILAPHAPNARGRLSPLTIHAGPMEDITSVFTLDE
jgi:hypothetical protein